jgi:hypothetical protein
MNTTNTTTGPCFVYNAPFTEPISTMFTVAMLGCFLGLWYLDRRGYTLSVSGLLVSTSRTAVRGFCSEVHEVFVEIPVSAISAVHSDLVALAREVWASCSLRNMARLVFLSAVIALASGKVSIGYTWS